ncbi:hypothetical protein ACFP3I_14510 [Chryseobacterium arachidis]|uniref:hypothetical protein n=1 Tax=Chryseobacterium arachidis TaxID=1416778 RepID=UPI0036076BB3
MKNIDSGFVTWVFFRTNWRKNVSRICLENPELLDTIFFKNHSKGQKYIKISSGFILCFLS